jgi:hypothetical protein
MTQTELAFDSPRSWREWFPETIEAIQRVEENADSEWFLFALMSLCRVAKQKPDLTTDDVDDYMKQISLEMTGPPPTTHEPRAMGPVMTRGAKYGWIERTNADRNSKNRKSHDRPKRVWRSLIVGRKYVPNGKQPC